MDVWDKIVWVVGYVAVGAVGLQILLSLGLFAYRRLGPRFQWRGKHVLVTGGSKGLGREVAILAARRGASVTILARQPAALKETLEALEGARADAGQRFLSLSCDVTDHASVVAAVAEAREKTGPLDVTIACAGAALPGLVTDVASDVFEKQMRLNYLGTVYAVQVRALLEREKWERNANTRARSAGDDSRHGRWQEARQDRHRELDHGGVRLCGLRAVRAHQGGSQVYARAAPRSRVSRIFSCAAYAETLRNELVPHGISVHHFLPPTMKTEGLEAENKLKPEITKLIEGTGDLLEPSDCAKGLFDGIDRGIFHIAVDALTDLMRVQANGTAPRGNVFFEALISPIIFIVLAIVTAFFDNTVKTFKPKNN